ncbi:MULTISPECIES: hypothetical protein [Flavobacterium]|uniref:Uncharacterized protein n=1 Tax=Flavobacterium keumense TaxID=1306518 RepID=A0ABY8N6H7_9FLAO|nr:MULTISPECIES: hypothetical protein [Flavobacterium]WGK95250.1 hypothetical protein MG292_03190 [Flavobacterium keumense]
MKKTISIVFLFLLTISSFAQQEKGITGFENWLSPWTDFKPIKTEYNEPNQILSGTISTNAKLLKKHTYLLLGKVYVTNNASLTIEPGTVIIGDYESKGALIITKGASLIADGSQTDPIVFTSNRSVKKSGDWGGVIILGDAPINRLGGVASVNLDSNGVLTSFGGNNSSSNSGILRYVRIEFAGAKSKEYGEFNGLLLAGVGSKTILENIMVSYATGDSFEVLGGEVTLKKAISYRCSKDDFKFNYGAQSILDNSIAIRSPFLTNNLGSRCLHAVSYDKRDEVDFSKKMTKVLATNITLVNNSQDIRNDVNTGLVREAIYVGENTSIELNKSVISGFNPAVILQNTIAINDENLNKIKFKEMYFNLCKGNIFIENNSNNEDLENWYGNAAFFNVYSNGQYKDTFIDSANEKTPDFRLSIDKITASKND